MALKIFATLSGKAQISAFISAWNIDWSHVRCQIFIFFCSFSWLAFSYKLLFFSSCHLLVYDKNQWKLKPSTVIYKMQLLYTTHSKAPVVYMLRHNLCHLPPERYWSYSVNILQKGCWMQAQGNMWLLGLICNLINNDLILELCSLLHCFLWLNLLFLNIAPTDPLQRVAHPSLMSLGRTVISVIHTKGAMGESWRDLAEFYFSNGLEYFLTLKVVVV